MHCHMPMSKELQVCTLLIAFFQSKNFFALLNLSKISRMQSPTMSYFMAKSWNQPIEFEPPFF